MRQVPYPAYKSSGVDWLGDIPRDWKIAKLKEISRYWVSNVDKIPADAEIPVRLCNYVDVYKNERITVDMAFMESTATSAEITRFGLREGDVLLTKDSESWQDIGVPALVETSAADLVCGYHLATVRPNVARVDPRFLFRLLQSETVNKQFQLASNGVTRFGLPKGAIGSAALPLPELPEQSSIARFLDRKTREIDSLIAKKRELIGKLNEKRSVLISQVVTRGLPPEAARAAGLDPYPQLKPSGIDWLGDIPEHWGIKSLRFVATIGNGSTPLRDNAEYWSDGTFPWLNSSVVNQDEVITPTELVSEAALRECHLPIVAPPAVLVGITGEGRTRGLATTLRIDATINQHLAFLKPKGGAMDVDYLRRVMDHAHRFLRDESDGGGSTKGAITCELLSHLRVPVPPGLEQVTIAAYLAAELGRIKEMNAAIGTVIERVQEYRSALITAAVTGQIDVRGTTG